jgi:serine/threonine protein kinase
MTSEKRYTTFPGSSQKCQIPPRLPLNVNRKVTSINNANIQNESPWKKFHGFLEIYQAGWGTVAYENCSAFPVVIIKKIRVESAKVPERVKNISHANVVHLHEVFSDFSDGPCLYMVYDCMSVSLTDIQSTPCGSFEEFEIAAICNEVTHLPAKERLYTNDAMIQILQGITYIHKELNMVHGKVDPNHILLSREGAIKIGLLQ